MLNQNRSQEDMEIRRQNHKAIAGIVFLAGAALASYGWYDINVQSGTMTDTFFNQPATSAYDSLKNLIHDVTQNIADATE